MTEHPIHFASGADERFAPGLLVAVGSALTALPRSSRAFVHVLDGGLSAKSRRLLEKTCFRLGADVAFHGVDTAAFASFQPGAQGSKMYYARLHLAELVPADRLVYFDSDTVILGNLAPFFQTDMSSIIALACPDRKVHSLAEDCPWPLEAPEREAPYFNSGFLVINLKKWREADVSRQALALAARANDRYRWHDQSVLNYALRGRVGILPAHWNWQQERSSDELPVDQLVLHFTTPKKPWTFFGADLRHRVWREFFKAFANHPVSLFLQRREFHGLASGLAENILRRSTVLRSIFVRSLAKDAGTFAYYTSGPGGPSGRAELAPNHPLLAEVRRRIGACLT